METCDDATTVSAVDCCCELKALTCVLRCLYRRNPVAASARTSTAATAIVETFEVSDHTFGPGAFCAGLELCSSRSIGAGVAGETGSAAGGLVSATDSTASFRLVSRHRAARISEVPATGVFWSAGAVTKHWASNRGETAARSSEAEIAAPHVLQKRLPEGTASPHCPQVRGTGFPPADSSAPSNAVSAFITPTELASAGGGISESRWVTGFPHDRQNFLPSPSTVPHCVQN